MKRIVLYFFMAISLLILVGCEDYEDYYVNFETKDEDLIERVLITEGNPVDEPIAEERIGYTFNGWYTDRFLANEYNFDSLITKEITLFAEWQTNVHNFDIFLVIDSTLSLFTSEEYLYGSNISDPQLDFYDYEVEGWYLDEDLLIPYIFATMPDNDLVIYANLVPEEVVENQDYEIALIIALGGIDDESANQAAWEGIVTFAEENSISYKYYSATENSDLAFLEQIDMAISNGAEIVVLPSWFFETSVYTAQSMYRDIQFILMDGLPHDADWINWVTNSNTLPVLFNEHEAGFLAGYAAVKDGYTKLGFTGGMAVPVVVKYSIGYIAGAYYAAEELGVTLDFGDDTFTYLGGFYASDEFKSIAASWYTSSTEVIFSVAGGANAAVMAAAEDSGDLMIGADFDQASMSSTVLTSAMKDYQSALYQVLVSYYDETLVSGEPIMFGVTNDGVKLPMDTSRFTTFTQSDYDAIYELLRDGTVVVPSDYASLVIFLGDATGYPTQQIVEQLN